MNAADRLLLSDDLYHTGIVVADLAAAIREFGALGYQWGFSSDAVVAAGGSPEMPVLFHDGPRMIEFAFVYSAPGPHRLELVRAIPGTIWELDVTRAAHHIGYWCDDVLGTSAALDAAGAPWTARVGVSSLDEPPAAVMHRTPSGIHIELVDRALRGQMFPTDLLAPPSGRPRQASERGPGEADRDVADRVDVAAVVESASRGRRSGSRGGAAGSPPSSRGTSRGRGGVARSPQPPRPGLHDARRDHRDQPEHGGRTPPRLPQGA